MNILYALSKGDPCKIKALESLSLESVYSFYYLRRVEKLNEALTILSRFPPSN